MYGISWYSVCVVLGLLLFDWLLLRFGLCLMESNFADVKQKSYIMPIFEWGSFGYIGFSVLGGGFMSWIKYDCLNLCKENFTLSNLSSFGSGVGICLWLLFVAIYVKCLRKHTMGETLAVVAAYLLAQLPFLAFIRFGSFMSDDIVGVPVMVSWYSVLFRNHPVALYESGFLLTMFFVGVFVGRRCKWHAIVVLEYLCVAFCMYMGTRLVLFESMKVQAPFYMHVSNTLAGAYIVFILLVWALLRRSVTNKNKGVFGIKKNK